MDRFEVERVLVVLLVELPVVERFVEDFPDEDLFFVVLDEEVFDDFLVEFLEEFFLDVLLFFFVPDVFLFAVSPVISDNIPHFLMKPHFDTTKHIPEEK